MSSRATYNKLPLNDVNLLATGTQTGPVINIEDVTDCAIQLNWTGTPTGTLTLEVCIVPTKGGTSQWTTLSGITLTSPAGAPGVQMISLTGIQFPQIRWSYAATSGTGVMSTWVHAKGGN